MYQERSTKALKRRRLFKFIGYGVVVVSLLIAVGVTVNQVFFDDDEAAQNVAVPESIEEPAIEGSYSSRWMFSGTVVTARAVENEARRADGTVDWAEVFSQFDSFEPEKYSEWFVDYECPVTTNTIPYRTQVENTVFNCEPSVFPEASKYFSVANIANNHTRDQGDSGFTETRQNIIDGGLQPVGHWDPRVSEDACEVTALTFTIEQTDVPTSEVDMPVAVCAFHHFEKPPLESDFDVIDEYIGVMPVIGLMQVGAEYRATNDERQQEVARAMIDRGVEFVVGNSPHWVQNTEVYKDKLIVYSTGNFIFDQLDEETNRGLSLDVAVSGVLDQNVLDWIELATLCKPEEFQDDCLAQAKTAGLSKLNFNYAYDVVASTGGFRELTQRAPAAVQQAVESRANWSETLKKLNAETN